ncbi:hypothetical protein [Haladaptatus salinisoli]|uniref:hypothetical protein n=1 Tax=Haladaptatus salinisoli TaxID=2884876 RepID=UPI001D0B873B|nr:hypothetical protein [Haladaptatus salinisoli]
MPRIRLKVKIGADNDNWLAGVSTGFSDAKFKILSSNLTDNGVLEIAEVTTPDGDAIIRRFDDAPEVRSYEVLHSDAQMVDGVSEGWGNILDTLEAVVAEA